MSIPALYAKTRQSVTAELSDIEWYSATTDLCSTATMDPYPGYTVHYSDANWELKSESLKTIFCPVDHTGANLAEALTNILGSWELAADKQVCLTTDNGSNVVSASRILSWQCLSCFGDNLDLAVTNSIKGDS